MSIETFTPNGIPAGTTLAGYVRDEGITRLLLSPVRDVSEAEDEGTDMQVCLPEEADNFAIYGWTPGGTSLLIHDCDSEGTEEDDWHAGHEVLAIMRGTRLPIQYEDLDRRTPVAEDITGLMDWLTTAIHDELPDYDAAEDFPQHLWDEHPVTPLRDLIYDVTPGCGIDAE